LFKKGRLPVVSVWFICILACLIGCQRSLREIPEESKIPLIRGTEIEKEPDQPFDNI
jgi:hypothetical protein